MLIHECAVGKHAGRAPGFGMSGLALQRNELAMPRAAATAVEQPSILLQIHLDRAVGNRPRQPGMIPLGQVGIAFGIRQHDGVERVVLADIAADRHRIAGPGVGEGQGLAAQTGDRRFGDSASTSTLPLPSQSWRT